MTKRVFLVAVAGLALGACAQEDAPDFCKDHAQYHAEHVDASAELSIVISEAGQIQSELTVPNASAREATADISSAANVFTLESENQCNAGAGDVGSAQGDLRATYNADCGADNKLGQINVLLFDAFPNLDEVLVHVTTPVTEKHFAIHRQCAAAIFRLD